MLIIPSLGRLWQEEREFKVDPWGNPVPNRGTAGFSSVWVVFRMRTVGKHS
jgi:hypothetical protein